VPFDGRVTWGTTVLWTLLAFDALLVILEEVGFELRWRASDIDMVADTLCSEYVLEVIRKWCKFKGYDEMLDSEVSTGGRYKESGSKFDSRVDVRPSILAVGGLEVRDAVDDVVELRNVFGAGSLLN